MISLGEADIKDLSGRKETVEIKFRFCATHYAVIPEELAELPRAF